MAVKCACGQLFRFREAKQTFDKFFAGFKDYDISFFGVGIEQLRLHGYGFP